MKRFIYEVFVNTTFAKTRRGRQIAEAVANMDRALLNGTAEFESLKFNLARLVTRINNDFPKGKRLELKCLESLNSASLIIQTTPHDADPAEVRLCMYDVKAEPNTRGLTYLFSLYPDYGEKAGE